MTIAVDFDGTIVEHVIHVLVKKFHLQLKR